MTVTEDDDDQNGTLAQPGNAEDMGIILNGVDPHVHR